MRLVLLSALSLLSASEKLPEEGMRANEIVEYNGYPVEYHNTTTSDGYILTIVRIPHGKSNGDSKVPRPPVFLQHGLGASCMNWITNLPTESLGYILADAGYDVYMGNVRGNSYSQDHIHYKLTDKQYWDYSWQDLAKVDLPTMVEKALGVNGQFKRLFFVGHGQGSLMGLAYFSFDTTWAQAHIQHFFALAPVYTVKAVTSPLYVLAPFVSEINDLYEESGGVGSRCKWLGKYVNNMNTSCNDTIDICDPLELYILGPQPRDTLNETRIPIFFADNEGCGSMKNIIQWLQMVNSGRCQEFDYGIYDNWAKYGCWSLGSTPGCPPTFDVSTIQTQITIFWGAMDPIADPADVWSLIQQIPKTHLLEKYYHLDFLFHLNVVNDIYSKILATIKSEVAIIPRL